MPLLGRHKSSAASPPATGANNYQQQAATTTGGSRQQLCESPLFGIRRQLPTTHLESISNSSLVSQQQQAGCSKQQRQQQIQTPSVNSTGLSSIPQQISRQQIHYAFSIMDSNKDGQVDVRDLSQMLSNLGVPIDEAILSHVMKNTVSKRGDHRISEAEFLDWISHFIQIRSDSSRTGSNQQQARGAGSKTALRVTRSSTAGSSASLVAQPSEAPRTRRGSGSGLALMRSLSSSSASSSSSSSAAANNNANNNHSHSHSHDNITKKPPEQQSCDRKSASATKSKPTLQQQSSTDSVEARNDLKAAFCVFDLDGDGYITLDEVRAGLKLLGESWSPMELCRLFSKCSGSPTTTSDLSKQRISIDDFVQLLL